MVLTTLRHILVGVEDDGGEFCAGEVVVIFRQTERSVDAVHERHADADQGRERGQRDDNELGARLIHELGAHPRVTDAQIAIGRYRNHDERRERDVGRNQELVDLKQSATVLYMLTLVYLTLSKNTFVNKRAVSTINQLINQSISQSVSQSVSQSIRNICKAPLNAAYSDAEQQYHDKIHKQYLKTAHASAWTQPSPLITIKQTPGKNIFSAAGYRMTRSQPNSNIVLMRVT